MDVQISRQNGLKSVETRVKLNPVREYQRPRAQMRPDLSVPI